MKFTQNTVVGLIFFAALAALLWFTVVQDPSKNIFGPPSEELDFITVTFSKVGGLDEGTKVRASGVNVGVVEGLEYVPETGKVSVRIQLSEKLQLFPGHTFTVKNESALGGRYIDVEIGDTTLPAVVPPYDKGSTLARTEEGRVQPDVLDSLGGLVDENRGDLRATIQNIRKVTESIAEGEGTVGLLVKERKLYDDLSAALDELRATIRQAREGQGTVGKLLNDPAAYDKLVATLDDVEEIAGKIRRGEGTIGKLVNDEAAYNDLQAALDSAKRALDDVQQMVADVRAGKGTVGMLMTDEKVAGDAREIISNTKSITGKIDRGEGTLGKLITDDRLYDGLLTAIGNVKEITADVNAGKGTIGKLVKDDTLYFELRKAVRSISASVEDAREQAPVSLFTSILFSAF